mmetsp:Transcript_9275/g.12157  ORF Transcript_9275/g.12157 Transcript_9275/m.12157 type:complete len:351 (-) Transcript_9275:198-1250(-)
MAAAAESASFHYLQHQQVKIIPTFIKAKEIVPPTFEELWGNGEDLPRRLLRKEEKLFWRTRHRLEFIIEELRSDASIIISIREVDSDKEWRPIIVDSKILFPLIDDKKTIKKGTGLDNDSLARAASDYIVARLKPSNGEQPLPLWYQPTEQDKEATDPGTKETKNEVNESTKKEENTNPSSTNESEVIKDGEKVKESEWIEQQAMLDKLSHDTWEVIERAPTEGTINENRWLKEWNDKKQAMEEAALATSLIEKEDVNNPQAPTESTEGVKADKQSSGDASAAVATESATESATDEGKAKKAVVNSSKKVVPAPTAETKSARKSVTKPTTKAETKAKPSVKAKGNKVAPS